MRSRVLLGVSLAAGGAVLAFEPPANRAPIASNPVVEVRGKIARVQAVPGRGAPYLEVEQNGQITKVQLGSMRYLVEQNFNPKAGAPVEVKGYRTANEVVASWVFLPGENKSLRLRDEGGWPVWRKGGERRCPRSQ